MDESNSDRYIKLSDRELEVLKLLVAGFSNKEIARAICLSPETVKSHMRSIFAKLCTSSRTQAAVKALELGLVE